MATRSTSPARRAVRSLSWLMAIVIALGALLGAGTLFWGWKWAPQLGLDLQGGTEIILTPQLTGGQPTTDELNQAVSIIRQRVDAAGVSESEISTQGVNNIVVSIPGTPDAATLQRIKASAKLDFRAVICASSTSSPSAACTPTAPTASPTATPAPSASATPELSDTPTTKPTSGSDEAWVTPKLLNTYSNFKCSSLSSVDTNVASPKKPLVTCDDQNVIYILGPVEVAGERISDASAGTATSSQGVSTGQWVVNLSFDGTGTTEFSNVSTRLLPLADPRNRFAVVLDGRVITSPTINEAIPNGKAQISGNFTQVTASSLADQLKYGALPIGFKVQSQNTIAATLGKSQLQNGLIAGGIGLLLVVIYSLFQYRLLGLVTILSLIVAAALTYEVINFLSWQNGYRLSLAGVAGLIVAIGFTADSFIVYFERIRDELRDGRALPGAVEAGWKRALRTIYAAKSVNLLSAIVLFIVAVGNVKGFALTLGITTVIDVLIVIMFTHPMLQLIAQTRFFASGHPLSGLDPTALGAIYRGRAEFRFDPAARRTGASREAARRQTIAERKAAELAAATTKPVGSTATTLVEPAQTIEPAPLIEPVEIVDAEDTTTESPAGAAPATSAARAQPKRSSKSSRTGGKKS